ncbi:MAG TPA: hypothetical protein VFV34_19810, partial [Blastocatellia bacterium]|nr:hypothetical protein [Blastocatellia bacterium]
GKENHQHNSADEPDRVTDRDGALTAVDNTSGVKAVKGLDSAGGDAGGPDPSDPEPSPGQAGEFSTPGRRSQKRPFKLPVSIEPSLPSFKKTALPAAKDVAHGRRAPLHPYGKESFEPRSAVAGQTGSLNSPANTGEEEISAAEQLRLHSESRVAAEKPLSWETAGETAGPETTERMSGSNSSAGTGRPIEETDTSITPARSGSSGATNSATGSAATTGGRSLNVRSDSVSISDRVVAYATSGRAARYGNQSGNAGQGPHLEPARELASIEMPGNGPHGRAPHSSGPDTQPGLAGQSMVFSSTRQRASVETTGGRASGEVKASPRDRSSKVSIQRLDVQVINQPVETRPNERTAVRALSAIDRDSLDRCMLGRFDIF